MLEGRSEQFVAELIQQGSTKAQAENEINVSIDRIVYYAGWCDKYQALLSSVNPVASSHFNFSVLEPTGVVGIIPTQESSLIGLISLLMPVICGGNTAVIIASENLPLCAVTFAEVLNSSDLPGGVVNILTGMNSELNDTISTHMDVNAIVYGGNDSEALKKIQENAMLNVKRIFNYEKDWIKSESQDLYMIADTQEVKTTWHPIENIGGSSSSY
jgi:acyl-CoA reductase-like NAD-dependent aldehyde dehydrogenase